LLCDYDIDYIAAFEGCSADANADFATVVRLIEEFESHSAKCVLVCEDSDKRLAQTVLSSVESGGEIFVMNSLQSVSQVQIEGGLSYLGAMRDNLGVIKAALGAKN
jgi:zinc transport system substrate-binding protein